MIRSRRRLFSSRVLLSALALCGCAAPLTLAEPRDGGVDGSSPDESGLTSFGPRSDAEDDIVVTLQSEGGRLEDSPAETRE